MIALLQKIAAWLDHLTALVVMILLVVMVDLLVVSFVPFFTMFIPNLLIK